ncbi:MAG TPA: metalloregulator ArsR/SmtB family transcription factor [Chloroflexota bacterium]|jgi:ArsR family transcriptional regulator|nr:metalloregulator ArsR/SmtB family transcription factor [Chloroflexota bacterium]
MSHQKSTQPLTPEALAEVRAGIPDDGRLQYVTEAFDALGDPTRARIVYALAKRALCVGDIASIVGVSESATSHQLRILRDRRVVKAQRHGTSMYYSVDDPHIAAMIREAEYHAGHAFHRLPDHPYPEVRHEEPKE